MIPRIIDCNNKTLLQILILKLKGGLFMTILIHTPNNIKIIKRLIHLHDYFFMIIHKFNFYILIAIFESKMN